MTDAQNSATGDTGSNASHADPAKRPMIYVVDDDHDVRSSLRFLLETEGFDVRTFRNGASLLGSPVRDRADCLVIDYKMAELDGVELALRLRRLDVTTPVILITGFPEPNIAAKARSAGVCEVLLKPNLEGNLIDCMRQLIDLPPT